jgi:hypothetical protein
MYAQYLIIFIFRHQDRELHCGIHFSGGSCHYFLEDGIPLGYLSEKSRAGSVRRVSLCVTVVSQIMMNVCNFDN